MGLAPEPGISVVKSSAHWIISSSLITSILQSKEIYLIDINFHLNFYMRLLEMGVTEEGASNVGLLWEEKNYSEQKWNIIVVFHCINFSF